MVVRNRANVVAKAVHCCSSSSGSSTPAVLYQ